MSQELEPCVKITRFLRLKKIVTLIELMLHLKCSARTVQRRLTECKAINSYNQNGRYYTLPEIPQFDVYGLWRHQGAFFSRYGNLPETFVHLVLSSPSGLTAAEVGALLGLRPSSFLWSLRNRPEVTREEQNGHYVYLASKSGLRARQQRQRSQVPETIRQPTQAESIAILVEKIKHPALSAARLSSRLKEQNIQVEPALIDRLFALQGLAVKKTPHSP